MKTTPVEISLTFKEVRALLHNAFVWQAIGINKELGVEVHSKIFLEDDRVVIQYTGEP